MTFPKLIVLLFIAPIVMALSDPHRQTAVGLVETPPGARHELTGISLSVDIGRVTVYLPREIRPGDDILGSFVLLPSDGHGADEFRNFTVEIEQERGGRPLASTSKSLPVDAFATTVLQNAQHLTIRLKRQGAAVAVAGIPIPLIFSTEPAAMGFQRYSIAAAAGPGRPLRVSGTFDKDWSDTSLHVGGKPATLIAGSPREAVFRLPSDLLPGPAEVLIREARVTEYSSTNVLSVSAQVGKVLLQNGETTPLTASIKGAAGLGENICVRFVNHSTAVVRFIGPSQFIVTPEEIQAGRMTFRTVLQGVRPGNFEIEAVAGPCSLEDYRRIVKDSESALTDALASANAEAIAGLRWTSGMAAFRSVDYPQANKQLAEAADLFRQIGARSREADALTRLGEVRLRLARPGEAIPNFERCLQISGVIGDAVWKPRCLAGLAEAHEALGDRVRAEQEYKAAILEIERNGSRQDKVSHAVYVKLVRFLVAEAKIDEALDYVQRSRCQTIIDTIASNEIGSDDPMIRSLVLRSGSLDDRRADLSQALRAENSKPKAEQDLPLIRGAATLLASTDKELNDTLARIRQHDPSYSVVTRVDPSVWADARDRLPEDVLLLEYLPTDTRLLIFATRGKGSPILKQVPIERTKLDGLIDRNRREIRNLDEANGAAQELYRLLIEPVRGEMESAQVLAVMPAGRLFYVPFGALYRDIPGRGRKYLIEEKPLALITELVAWRLMASSGDARTPAQPFFVAFANPTGDLKSAEDEVEKIGGRYLQKRIYAKQEATLARAQNIPSECTALHFAVHGVLLDTPVTRSHLKLADGLLTQKEIYGLGLKSKRTRLVVLSGCETASGLDQPGAEFLGLADAFSKAGASAVLGTLWKIETESAVQLMDRFYAGHTGNPRAASAAHALQQAQIEMLRSREFTKPFFWAPYVLIGDWR